MTSSILQRRSGQRGSPKTIQHPPPPPTIPKSPMGHEEPSQPPREVGEGRPVRRPWNPGDASVCKLGGFYGVGMARLTVGSGLGFGLEHGQGTVVRAVGPCVWLN